MKKIIRATAGALALLTGCAAMYGCKKKNEPQTVYERVADERGLDDFAYTVNSVSATDRPWRSSACACSNFSCKNSCCGETPNASRKQCRK